MSSNSRHPNEGPSGGPLAVAYGVLPQVETVPRLEQLFWEHHERVLRAAYRITGNMADAEDVAQSLFLRLAANPQEAMHNPESYFYRAAINGALDLLRSRKDGREVELGAAKDFATTAPGASPERSLSDRELRQWIRQALTELSPRTAEMFALRYFEERDNREIAKMLGTSQAVVTVMLHHARGKLKKKLQSFLRGER
jgi:RNA polymerase sigma-70 factor (ECF subfamily)